MAGRLSKSEREEYFKKMCEQYEQEGYTKKTVTCGNLEVNLMALVFIFLFLALVGGIFYWRNGLDLSLVTASTLGSLCVVIVLSVVVHEWIHGLFFGIFAKNHFKSVYYGFMWKAFAPYCNCIEPIKMWKYVIVILMPTVILGFLPSIVAILTGNLLLCAYGWAMIALGCGDLYILTKLMFVHIKGEKLVIDSPVSVSCVIFYK